jgi:hypothetical protein
MKIDMRRLTMTAVLLSTSIALPAVVHAQSYENEGYDDYYGTDGGFDNEYDDHYGIQQTAGTSYVGDGGSPAGPMMPGNHPQQLWGQPSAPMQHYGSGPGYGHGYGQGHGYSQDQGYSQGHGYGQGQGYGQSNGYGPNQYQSASQCCDSGCDSGARGAIGRAVGSDRPDVWIRAEMLLWFPQGRQTPPLGAASAQPGLPTAINHDFLFNEPFGNDLTPGFRGDVGRYFAGGAFGIGGRVWVLGDDDDSVGFSGNGTGTSFTVPFFNTFNGIGEDAVIVGFDDGGTQVSGQAVARSTFSIVAAELYGRALVGESRNHRFELLGGYSYFNISDELTLNINRTQVPPGSITTFSDDFRTRNEFHGGQIGNEIALRRGRWTASSLTKVHLGNMTQRVAVNGTSTEGIIGGGAATLFDEGLFARGDVQGVRTRDTFAFAPEMNLKLGYQFRPHVNFHVGYSFIYWNNVALAGDQMDRNLFVDAGNLGNAGPARFVDIKHDGYWVQGIDLGTTIEF